MIIKIVDYIWLGDSIDSLNWKYVKVDVRKFFRPGIDKHPNWEELERLIKVINNCVETKNECLVFCDGGLERSPLVIAAYLCEYRDIPMDMAYKMIKEQKPGVFRRDEWLDGKS